ALGLPVIAMAYPNAGSPGATLHAVHAAAELGAVLVQTHYTGSVESFLEVVRGCPVPVLVAGGPMASSPDAFLGMVRDAMAAGAGGVTAGRNLFQNPDPARFAAQIANLVFAGAPRVATGG
ncbi:MAG: fructose-bisphosphate aldolase, partial [Candidatus Thermoplasmatota archaeon]